MSRSSISGEFAGERFSVSKLSTLPVPAGRIAQTSQQLEVALQPNFRSALYSSDAVPSAEDPRNLRLMELAYHASKEQDARKLKDNYDEMLLIILELIRELGAVD